MKVGELREKLSKMKKSEVIALASEFYKLVPKAKKEVYDLDSMINNPAKKLTGKKQRNTTSSLLEIEKGVQTFISNARDQYYLYPNRVVSKKERSTWRFQVKRWYKELNNQKRADLDLAKQAKLQHQLYELLCESCNYEYFTAYDPFQSVGVEQLVYYCSVIELIIASEGKSNMVEKGIKLIVDNSVNRYTLPSELIEGLIVYLDIPDLKYKGIEKAKSMIKAHDYTPPKEPQQRSRVVFFSDLQKDYELRSFHNSLVALVLRLHLRLYEYEEGISYYHANYYESSSEINLFILISILFEFQLKDQIVSELERAIGRGIELRERLITLLNEIKKTDQLPSYMP
ncbi:MAG: hypothetical protein AAF927_32250 [Bacteroidota bacterium]